MKTPGGVIIACLLTLAAVSCDSANQEMKIIDSIIEMKGVCSGEQIALLYVLTEHVSIDNSNVIRLNFDPTTSRFGSHLYGNFESLLREPREGFQYYTMGNLNNYRTANICTWPDLNWNFFTFLHIPEVKECLNKGNNRHRIIFSVKEYNIRSYVVDEIYLTQHYPYSVDSSYDPNEIYIITYRLVRELRQFSSRSEQSLQSLRTSYNNNINNNQLNNLAAEWGRDVRLGLLNLILKLSKCWSYRRWRRGLTVQNAMITNDCNDCEIQHVLVQVVTGVDGNAKIHWENVPDKVVDGAAVLFRSQTDQNPIVTISLQGQTSGRYDTSVPLNEGLQVRLHKVKVTGVFDSRVMHTFNSQLNEEICRGKEFKSPLSDSVTSVARLQLFVKKGKACFRLYMKKGCYKWEHPFYNNSWVALYLHSYKDTYDYLTNQWQWAVNFKQGRDSGDYDTFEYCTGTTITTGLQARFVRNDSSVELARTPTWP